MLALAAMLPTAAPAAPSLAGTYQIHQMEMAGGLELRADGHFRYAFDYGAVSETAEGDWTATPTGVVLTSNPMPKAPSFALVADDPAPKGELWMTLEDPGFEWGTPLKAIAITAADAGQGVEISADDRGRVDLAGQPAFAEVAPLMPVYGATGEMFPLSPERGHRLRFRFHANDLGRVAFNRQPLRADGANLLLERFDTAIRFLPDRP
ncbi:MAG: hypothetical protein ABIS38_02105 [Sphingomicrobium sp.]